MIIATATLVTRRWGESIGGLIVGLPLTSGPVSVFFAIEQGPKFAAHAALGSILGLIPVAVFCTVYAFASKRISWKLSALFGIASYVVTIWGISWVTPEFPLVIVLVPAALSTALILIGMQEMRNTHPASPWWDLPVRIVIATGLLVSITTAASFLGAKWGGLLSPFPIFTFVMATFTHRQSGSESARRLIQGVILGLFAYLSFFAIVNLMVEQASLPFVYLLATVVAIGINSLILILFVRKKFRVTLSQP